MGLKYRKSIKIAPGVKLNVGKKSAGISVGGKYGGVSVNSKTGVRTRTSIPGTGISYTSSSGKKSHAKSGSNISAKKSPSAKPPRERNPYVELILCVFLGSLGVHKFYVGKIGLGILYLFTVGLFGIGWIVDIVMIGLRVIKGANSPKPSVARNTAPANDPLPVTPVEDENPGAEESAQADASAVPEDVENPYTEKVYHVTGVKYYMDALMRLATENPDYECSKREIIDSFMYDENIYRYLFAPKSIELVPEPENPYDKNAIKVVIDGEHIGHIKAGSCAHLLKVIREGRIHKISCTIGGGPLKRVVSDYDIEKDKDVYSLERETHPYAVVLRILEAPDK